MRGRTSWRGCVRIARSRRINELLTDIERNGHEGIGKPEALRHDLSGYWSRRITQKDRLIYTFDEKNIYIAACKGHYE